MKISPPVRGSDKWGRGDYLAPRGIRLHNGVDLCCAKGSRIYSPILGVVTKIGYPYNPNSEKKGHYRYVQVTDDNGLDHRFFYIIPTVEYANHVTTDTVIGISQGLLDVYPGISDHIHYEVKRQREFLDPTEFL